MIPGGYQDDREMIVKAEEKITKDYGKEQASKITLLGLQDTFTAILGPSGSGKSTLFGVLSGMIRALIRSR